jgi:hypothetical protein
MVYKTTRWRCDKCRRSYSSYDAAEDCEIGHIVAECTKPGWLKEALLRDSGSDRDGKDAPKSAAECEASQSGAKRIAQNQPGQSHD